MFVPVAGSLLDSQEFAQIAAKIGSAIVALVSSLKAQPGVRPRTPETWQERYRELEMKVRHPWKYRAQQLTRLFHRG